MRDAFYADPASRIPSGVDPTPLIAASPSAADTARELMIARQAGGRVHAGVLVAQAVRARDRHVWADLAWVDAECAGLILSEHREQVPGAALGLLHHAADHTLPLLLDVGLAVDGRPTSSRPDLDAALEKWISAGMGHGRRDGRPAAGTAGRRGALVGRSRRRSRHGRLVPGGDRRHRGQGRPGRAGRAAHVHGLTWHARAGRCFGRRRALATRVRPAREAAARPGADRAAEARRLVRPSRRSASAPGPRTAPTT